ncbi:MAG: SsrA-binding protein SmpB [Lentisphaerae bacterium]|nr:SsrA-binding protein SmpB [Lentisphaerota bacterium]
MGSQARKETSVLASNRKARHDFHILNRVEAGIELRGTEVKSLRAGQANLTGAYARAENGQMWLYHLTIPAYEFGNQFNHDPERVRRLLLHKHEIDRLSALVEQQGQTLVPLGLFLKNGRVKVDLGICKGKTHGDQRETLRRRTADREAQRAIAARK